MKVVELDSITHQGKVLKMLGEIGTAWLNPKLDEKKITVIEYSSSQDELEDSEEKNKKVMKGKNK